MTVIAEKLREPGDPKPDRATFKTIEQKHFSHPLDFDRGVTGKTLKNGGTIWMYDDTPGVFLDGRGQEVSSELARDAGWDVETLAIERLRRERISQAQSSVFAKMEKMRAQVARNEEMKKR